MNLRKWIAVRRGRRSRRIVQAMDAMRVAALEDADDDVPRPGNGTTRQRELDEARRVAEEFDAEFPPVVFRSRTWVWWVRWAGVLAVGYAGTSWIVYGLRHPELTDVQRLLDFWPAMTWR